MRESLTMTPHHRISLSTPKERRAEKHHPHPPYFSLPVVLTWGEASGNLRFVWAVAREYKGIAPEDDLICAGNLGLMEAAIRFNPDVGCKFITYAVWCIRARMQDACIKNRTVHIPRYRILNRAKMRREQAYGLSVKEIAHATGFSETRVDDLLSVTGTTYSLDAPVSDDAGSLFRDLLHDGGLGPDQAYEERDVRRRLMLLVGGLSRKHAKVVTMYHGLGDERPMTLAAIGRTTGRSRERIRQILQSAHQRLRDQWSALGEDEPDRVVLVETGRRQPP